MRVDTKEIEHINSLWNKYIDVPKLNSIIMSDNEAIVPLLVAIVKLYLEPIAPNSDVFPGV